jgi:hypothetical protein
VYGFYILADSSGNFAVKILTAENAKAQGIRNAKKEIPKISETQL